MKYDEHSNYHIIQLSGGYMRNKLSNVLWGLFFVIVGVGIAGNIFDLWNFRLFFAGWWTLFIIIPCFIGMIQNGVGSGSTIGFIIGVLLLSSHYVGRDLVKLIIPAIFVFIGLRLIFRDLFRRKPKVYDNPIYTDNQNFKSSSEYSAIFASNNIDVKDQHFTGTSLNSIFGGIVLDLRDAIIDHDVEINATAIFGGIDIYVPRGVRVKVNNVPIFGGVSNKADKFTEPGAPTIYVCSTCMFGGIDIK